MKSTVEEFEKNDPDYSITGNAGSIKLLKSFISKYNPPKKRRKNPTSDQPKVSLCRVCGSRMVRRTNSYTGKSFFGCSSFPRCRYTIELDGTEATTARRRGDFS